MAEKRAVLPNHPACESEAGADERQLRWLGFNGELCDPLIGHYLLGNGYRMYNTVLMRFHSPDSLSPFGEGGINTYAYCQGDPVNTQDPTGHVKSLGPLNLYRRSSKTRHLSIRPARRAYLSVDMKRSTMIKGLTEKPAVVVSPSMGQSSAVSADWTSKVVHYDVKYQNLDKVGAMLPDERSLYFSSIAAQKKSFDKGLNSVMPNYISGNLEYSRHMLAADQMNLIGGKPNTVAQRIRKYEKRIQDFEDDLKRIDTSMW